MKPVLYTIILILIVLFVCIFKFIKKDLEKANSIDLSKKVDIFDIDAEIIEQKKKKQTVERKSQQVPDINTFEFWNR